jgi:nicotinamidase-related amidase
MLRCFLEEGHVLFIGKQGRFIIPHVQALLEKELSGGARVFFVCDNHDPDDLEFRMFPPHCIEGSDEARVISELASYPGEIIHKKRYSAFFGTNLEERLKKPKPDKLIICGVLTNICVLHTAADARNRDYKVEIPVDCIASSDEEAHRFALEQMENVLGATLVTSGG